jgi:glycosyltransferase involved in cell wall biosynthesis
MVLFAVIDIVGTIPIIINLRSKHSVNFYGYNKNEDKKNIFYSNHLLFLPTLNENFGHAIVENFLHCRPCLLSNNTPWYDNGNYNAGYSVSLKNKNKFINILKEFFLMNQGKFDKLCFDSKKYILYKLKSSNY